MPLFSGAYPVVALDAVEEEYDYIVVGGGTSGCVLANRLSTDPAVKVLLLERGNARTGWAARVPLLSTNFMGNDDAAYSWTSRPNSNLRDEDRTLNLVTGKGLGGGSAINSMMYTRGYPQEFDLWSQNGRKGWSFREVEEYFKRSERFEGRPVREWHGSEGEWIVRDMGHLYFPSARACVNACESLGLPHTQDLNDPQTPFNTCAKVDFTIDPHGHRSSTFTAFLPQTLAQERRSHLHICTGAAVCGVTLEKDVKTGVLRATGVRFQSATGEPGGKVYHVRARREVILSAGPIATPQILLLSGLGPADKVKKPLQKQLSGVGQNLQDHLGVGIMYNVPTADSLHIVQKSPLRAILELFRYIAYGEGLFLAPVVQLAILANSSCIDDSGNIIPSPNTEPSGLPDIEIMPIHFNFTDPPIPCEAGVLSFAVVLLRPASRGSISLASDNALERPHCDMASLSDPADLAVLRKGIKLAKRIGEKMREQGMHMTDLYMPQSDADEDLDAFIRKTARTSYHYACTARMAPEGDARPGVVDDELRVHGVEGLRVADTSVLPDVMSAHLQAPAVMIAEKCAHMVQQAHL